MSLSEKGFSDPHINRVARYWMDSILCMCLTKYGFHTGQAYSRIGRTTTLKAVLIATGSFHPNVLLIRPNTRFALLENKELLCKLLEKIQSKCPSAYVYQQPTDYSHLPHTDEIKDI